jgi:hypothetical protein
VTTQPSDPATVLTPGGGIAEEDLAVFRRGLARALSRLDGHPGARTEISIKDRGTPGQCTTVEVWLPRLPRVVATSRRAELPAAAAELDSKVTDQLNELTGRRQPRNNRQRRDSIRTSRNAEEG